MVEWISHLSRDFEIHIYSQKVDDIDLTKIVWHRIPALKGPHLFGFLWWFFANHLWRSFDRRFRGLDYDLVFSPGPNCLDADAMSVHILFFEYVREVRERLRLTQNVPWFWPRIVHRRLYYSLIGFLERRTYRDPRKILIVISRSAASLLEKFSGRTDFPILYAGVDGETFNPQRRAALRESARKKLGLSQNHFALLLVGNDWRNKGVPVLLEAMEQLRALPLYLLLVSHEDLGSCWKLVRQKRLENRVLLLPPRNDIEFYYAAADVYTGPSRHDSYAMPPAEAMACGLPVIVSAMAGVSEIVTDEQDGLILDDPTDGWILADMIRRLYEDEQLRARLGGKGAETTRKYTWAQNGRDLTLIFDEILRRKSGVAQQTLAQEP